MDPASLADPAGNDQQQSGAASAESSVQADHAVFHSAFEVQQDNGAQKRVMKPWPAPTIKAQIYSTIREL